MEKITIGLLRPGEVGEFSRMARNIITSTPYYSRRAKSEESQKFTPKNVRKMMGDKDNLFTVARSGRGIVAFECGHYDSGTFYGDWFGTRKDFRNRGIMLRVLQFRDGYVKRHGVHKVWCDSRMNNKEAISLYRKRGFKVVARLKRHWYGQDFYIWQKFL